MKPRVSSGPLGPVEMDSVLIFLIEAHRAFRAVDLVGIAHLAARGGAAENRDAPIVPLAKRTIHLRVVVIVDRDRAVPGRGAVACSVSIRAEKLRDGAHDGASRS